MEAANYERRTRIGAATLQSLAKALLGAGPLQPLRSAPVTHSDTAPPAMSNYGRRRRRRMRR